MVNEVAPSGSIKCHEYLSPPMTNLPSVLSLSLDVAQRQLPSFAQSKLPSAPKPDSGAILNQCQPPTAGTVMVNTPSASFVIW